MQLAVLRSSQILDPATLSCAENFSAPNADVAVLAKAGFGVFVKTGGGEVSHNGRKNVQEELMPSTKLYRKLVK
jgi:hypothetical protein